MMEVIVRGFLGGSTAWIAVTQIQEGFPGVSTPVDALVLAAFLGMTGLLAVYPGNLGK